jgi:AICAR transformylase/IMP cyclohydrolase PurH
MEIRFSQTNDIIIDSKLGQDIENIPMQGTEKQVSWAKEIRRNAVIANVKRFNSMVDGMQLRQQEMTPEQRQAAAAGISKLASIEDARFWIDNRETNPQMMMSKYGR